MGRSANRLTMLAVVILAQLTAVFADSTYMGIQPGLSTREKAEKVLGQPVATTDQRSFEYSVAGVSGKIIVEYRSDGIVDRIERRFARAVTRSAMIRSLSLPEEPEEKGKTREGKFVEYFGGIKTLALIYRGQEPASGVIAVGYYSLEVYDAALGQARNPKVQFDPSACRDVYTWAQTERDAAKRSKNLGRFQSILEIAVLAQRGECGKARPMADDYKTRYR
ncbi:MAG: hypothetical protein IPM59_10070 [Chloracidobacterium sp.]|nr:hypothetical protein [Chloracidobacterium sp.]